MKFSAILVDLFLNVNDNHSHLENYSGIFFMINRRKYLTNVELGFKILFRTSLMFGFAALYIYSWLILYQ